MLSAAPMGPVTAWLFDGPIVRFTGDLRPWMIASAGVPTVLVVIGIAVARGRGTHRTAFRLALVSSLLWIAAWAGTQGIILWLITSRAAFPFELWATAFLGAAAGGLLGPVAALTGRRALRGREGGQAATLVTLCAAVGVMCAGAALRFFLLAAASLGDSDAPSDVQAASDRTLLVAVATATAIVVIALVAVRVRRWNRGAFILALLSPLLPGFLLTGAGVAQESAKQIVRLFS